MKAALSANSGTWCWVPTLTVLVN
ncbi:uncharacterized protein METZ01_LOCUS13860 [marine metagenome]|uniref:Uncharacterized protein n=1 Tax=marine metagenome TaxID=408172 RepID=A0A381P232_9ZZZZ